LRLAERCANTEQTLNLYIKMNKNKRIIIVLIVLIAGVFMYFKYIEYDYSKQLEKPSYSSPYEKSNYLNETESTTNRYQGPPKFVLTEMNGRELENKAFFTIQYDNNFKLELDDGTIFTYKPTNHFGDDPLCNILANDDLGRKTAICIKKLDGLNVMIMLENDDMKSNFKGYKYQ